MADKSTTDSKSPPIAGGGESSSDSKAKQPLSDPKLKQPLSDPKLKQPLADSSSDDEKDAGTGDDDLGLSLEKLTLGPKKKLLVFCLGGVLVDRVHVKEKHKIRGLRADIVCGNFFVFKRAFCTEFLKFCFERFDVALWSSALERNIGDVLRNITGGMKDRLLFVWGQSECTDSGYTCLHNRRKPLFVKELKKIWEHKDYKGKYSASNTLLIDDEPHTSLLNPANTAIFPHPYKKRDFKDKFLGPNEELWKFLDGLVDAKNVPDYVKDHRIGQPAIGPGHPQWDEYSEMIANFGKKVVWSDDDSYSD